MDLFSKTLEDAVRTSHAPGAVACVGQRNDILFCGACGLRQAVPQPEPAETGTLYDLASLTKVVATTTAILMLRDDARIDLDQPVAEILPVPAFRRFTVRHCLTHTAGLDPGIPYFREVSSINEVLQRVSLNSMSAPPGASIPTSGSSSSGKSSNWLPATRSTLSVPAESSRRSP